MKFKQLLNQKNMGIMGAILGSTLFSMTLLPMAGIAESKPNPNLESNRGDRESTIAQFRTGPRDNLDRPVALLRSQNMPVEITLVNNTNDRITYQVIGDTDERLISEGGTATVRRIDIPVTVTFVRSSSAALLQVEPEVIGPGEIRLNLDETSRLDRDVTAMRIDETGEVYLY